MEGIGHGDGMSQNGARHLAEEGWSCQEILKYYYGDGVEIILRYVTQLVRWLLRFMDKSSEDRVDAYSAQSAFFIIMGFIPFVMLLLILLQYTPMTKEDVMTLLKVIFPEGFHAYLETLVGSVYTKSTALLSGTVITAVWACSKAMMSVSKGLNKIYDTKIRKNYFLARFRAALYIILLLISLILAMGAVCVRQSAA